MKPIRIYFEDSSYAAIKKITIILEKEFGLQIKQKKSGFGWIEYEILKTIEV